MTSDPYAYECAGCGAVLRESDLISTGGTGAKDAHRVPGAPPDYCGPVKLRPLATPRELERLRKIYPLSTFTAHPGRVEVAEAGASSPTHSFPIDARGRISWDAERNIIVTHSEQATIARLSALYEHLHFRTSVDKSGMSVAAWVKRDGRGVEATSFAHHVDAPEFHAAAAALDAEAEAATAEGWFYCSGHERAEQRGEGGWFYFAARYCKAYGDEHPRKRSDAAREDYR